MSLPVFGPDYLASPTMFGSVSPTTSKLLADAGKDIADQIEKQSTKFEAQQQAPEIATMMASGLHLLATGDPQGFNYLASAKAKGATNPFLAKMTSDALEEGQRTFQAHITESAADKRFNVSIDRQDQQINAAALNDKRIRERAAEDDLARADAARMKEHETTIAKFQQEEDAKRRIAERDGSQYVPGTPPPAPKPLSKTFGGAGAPSIPVDARAVSPKKLGAPVTPDGGLFGDTGLPQADVAATTFVPGQGPTPTAAVAPTATNPVAQTAGPAAPLVNETPSPAPAPAPAPPSKPGIESRIYGNMIIEVPKQADKPEETVKTESGSVKYDKQLSPASQFLAAIDKVQATDPAFTTWATDQQLNGNKVVIRSTGKAAGVEAFQPFAISKNKTEVPYGKIDPTTQQPTGVTQTVGKDTHDAFIKAQELMSGPLKGQVGVFRNVDDAGKQAAVNTAIQGVADKQYTLDAANQHLRLLKAPLITQRQIDDELALRQDEKKAGSKADVTPPPAAPSNITANPVTAGAGASSGMLLTPEDYRAMK